MRSRPWSSLNASCCSFCLTSSGVRSGYGNLLVASWLSMACMITSLSTLFIMFDNLDIGSMAATHAFHSWFLYSSKSSKWGSLFTGYGVLMYTYDEPGRGAGEQGAGEHRRGAGEHGRGAGEHRRGAGEHVLCMRM